MVNVSVPKTIHIKECINITSIFFVHNLHNSHKLIQLSFNERVDATVLIPFSNLSASPAENR